MQGYNIDDGTSADLEMEWQEFWPTKMEQAFKDDWEAKKKHYFMGRDRKRKQNPGPSGYSEKRSRMDDSQATEITIETLKLLTTMGNKLGPMAQPVSMWYDKAMVLHSKGLNPTVIFDKDSKTLLEMIFDKMKNFLRLGELTVVQKVIIEGAIEKVDKLIQILDMKDKEYFGLDIPGIGNATAGQNNFQTANYVRNVLSNIGYGSPRDVDKIMNAVLAFHQSLNGPPHVHRNQNQFNSGGNGGNWRNAGPSNFNQNGGYGYGQGPSGSGGGYDSRGNGPNGPNNYNQGGYGNFGQGGGGWYQGNYNNYNQGYGQGYDYNSGNNYYGGYGPQGGHQPNPFDGEFSIFKNSGVPIEALRKFKNFKRLDIQEKESAQRYLLTIETRDRRLADEIRKLMDSSFW